MKRKKKDEEDNKEPKPKKYKKKIENPEKKRARYVYDNKANNGKVWEKNRRDRLNTTFDELSLLLPQKEPPAKMSKVEILVAAIKEITELREKVQEHEPNVNIKENKSKSDDEKVKVVPEIRDVACNTDILEDKENNPLPKKKIVHKKIQVNLLRKKKKGSNELKLSSSETQTIDLKDNEKDSKNSNATAINASNESSENNCMALVPFNENSGTASHSIDAIQTSSVAASHLSSTMRMTPALISTPIMTPSLFISSYPFVVSQIPQSVLIVNNKTEVNTTVNKVVAVKSKSINGRIPLPPLKKTVAVKKNPRKKRVLKKKSEKDAENKETIEKVKISENTTTKDKEKMENVMQKNVESNIQKNIVCEKVEPQPSFSKESEPSVVKPMDDIPLPTTPLAISSGKLIERLDSNSSLLNAQDTSHINDTSGISNLDIENFSLLTANILSGIDANDTSETNLSSNLGKMLEDKDLDCNAKVDSLISIPNERIVPVVPKDKPIEKPIVEKSQEITPTKPRETIQVRKGLLQSEMKLPSHQHPRQEPMMVPSTSSFDNFNTLLSTSQTNNYPNFSLSLSQEMKTRTKSVSEAMPVISTKIDASYTIAGPSYSGNINYTGYYSNSNNSHSSLQQLYSNQHPNNIISSSYSNSYDAQRPYYADQPSTNFTFSLTSVAKSQAKYASSGTKSQILNQPSITNIQESCKKFPSKISTYNYPTENISAKNVTSHSIARLNSKYDNHKENDTPFYITQDVPCTKANVAQKLTYNQPVFTNNSSCARYPQQQQPQQQSIQTGSKQTSTNKSVKSSSLTTQQPQMSSRYDVDWMSSSEIKPSTNDFQLFPSLESTSMNQNSYYSSSISNFDINRKTSDLYFAHPPGEENLPWSPSRMSNLLDTPHLSGNQCFSSTLPNLHGDLALNTLSTGSSSRPNSIFETPTKSTVSTYNSSYSATKESKRLNNTESQQNNSFSVRQLVDINQPSKSTVQNDKCTTIKRKSSGRKEGEVDTFSGDINSYENHKTNIYSAESLINPRHGSKNKTWHTDAASHSMTASEANQNNSLFTMESSGENQYNYATTRYDPKFFKQNYVTSFVDNSFPNNTQNYNFSKSQPFTFGESNNSTLDYHQSSLGNSMNTFLSHHEMPEKQHYYPQSSKTVNPLSTNMESNSTRNNHNSSSVAAASSSHKKSKSSASHHAPTSTHHSLIMNYDFPVPPVTPSLSYFPTHEWKSTPTEPYPAMHPNACNSNSYVNSSSSNLYSQNILQNSQSQNLVSGLPSSNLTNNNGNHSQNTSNSLTNFNLSTICPEINDKVRQQNW